MGRHAKKQKKPVSSFLGPPDLGVSWMALTADIEEYTKRGFVLACGAVVDRSLEALLTAKFKETPDVGKKEIDWLLTESAISPLRSMGVRARIARVLGLIDKSSFNAIDDLIGIRNHFAHAEIPGELDNSLIAPVYANLPKEYRNVCPDNGGQLTPDRFLLVVTSILMSVLYRAQRAIETKSDHTSDQGPSLSAPLRGTLPPETP
jgi:hypothetical protein